MLSRMSMILSRSVVSATARRQVTIAAAASTASLPSSSSTTSNNTLPLFRVSTTVGAIRSKVDVRRGNQVTLWKNYVKTGQGANVLFDNLDLNCDGSISVSEIDYFIKSVEKEGVKDEALQLLHQLGEDHELANFEFRQWLNMAVEVETPPASADKKNDAPVVDDSTKSSSVQAAIWDSYLAGQDPVQNANNLFKTIDLDDSGSISVHEISFFLNSVHNKGMDQTEIDELQALGKDHQLTPTDFSVWLAGAVNPDHDKVTHKTTDAEGCTPQI